MPRTAQTKIKPTMTPTRARAIRDAELASAQDAYTERCRAINVAFAEVIRRAAEKPGSSMTAVAGELDMNRQNLHRLARMGQAAA